MNNMNTWHEYRYCDYCHGHTIQLCITDWSSGVHYRCTEHTEYELRWGATGGAERCLNSKEV